VRHFQSGQVILSVSVVNNTGFGDKQKANWFKVNLWGKRAEGELKNFLVKGQQVFVSGELSINEYEKDGQTKTSLEINATIIDLIGNKVIKSSEQQLRTPKEKISAQLPVDDDIPF
jgi:single-strand DNA-binding protein